MIVAALSISYMRLYCYSLLFGAMVRTVVILSILVLTFFMANQRAPNDGRCRPVHLTVGIWAINHWLQQLQR
jgi:hypothetical protein